MLRLCLDANSVGALNVSASEGPENSTKEDKAK